MRVSVPVRRMSRARRKAGRSPGRTANQVRVGRQSATFKSDRPWSSGRPGAPRAAQRPCKSAAP